MGRAAGVLGLLLTAGCHLVFPHDPRGDAAATPDLQFDVRPEVAVRDLPRDGGVPPFQCGAPELVGTGGPTNLHEAALRSDGIELVANSGNDWYSSKRQSDGSFGPWNKIALLSGKEDPTFFKVDDAELAVVARAPVPRVLELCTLAPVSCSPLTILDAVGPVTKDLDGPSVAVLPNGKLLMAHNLGVNTADGLVYLAEPTKPASLGQPWRTSPLPSLDRKESREDDPALSPDGLVIVMEGRSAPNADDDLWVSRRAGLEEPFPAQVPIAAVNSAVSDGSPCLAAISVVSGPPRYELFFTSARSGSGSKIYRAECW